MKIECNPNCQLDPDACRRIHLESEGNKFACEVMTDDELELYAKEYMAFLQRFREIHGKTDL